jgi:hypothetical protein
MSTRTERRWASASRSAHGRPEKSPSTTTRNGVTPSSSERWRRGFGTWPMLSSIDDGMAALFPG